MYRIYTREDLEQFYTDCNRHFPDYYLTFRPADSQSESGMVEGELYLHRDDTVNGARRRLARRLGTCEMSQEVAHLWFNGDDDDRYSHADES